MTLRVGYAKLGRALQLDEGKYGFQGDAEAPNLLRRLAKRNTDVEWVICGRNTGKSDLHIPNVTNMWDGWREKKNKNDWFVHNTVDQIADLDAFVIHAGNHAPSHHSIPFAGCKWGDPSTYTNPLLWAYMYGDYLIKGINKACDRTDGLIPIIWLVTDPRNHLKGRDIKWPTGCDDILAQYQFSRDQRHQRFRDYRNPEELGFKRWNRWEKNGEEWISRHRYRHAGLELMILPDTWERMGTPTFEERFPAGVATTSMVKTYSSAEPRRSQYVNDWVLNAFPRAEVFGKWDPTSLRDVPEGTVQTNSPSQYYQLLERWRTTVAMPVTGSGWTTAKPYQCWATNTVCFFLGGIDDQGYVLPTMKPGPLSSPSNHIGYTGGSISMYSVRHKDDWPQYALELAWWLRCDTIADYVKKAQLVASDKKWYDWIVKAQRALLKRRWDEATLEKTIEARLGL